MTASNDVVAQIYKLCLKHSIQKIGWAFNFNPYIDVVQIKSCKEMTWIIKNELSNTFDDMKRLRLRHMLKVINGVEDAKAFSNNYVYGIKNYHYVYEKMIDQLFWGLLVKKNIIQVVTRL